MSETLLPPAGMNSLAPVQESASQTINLAVIKKGAKDFLSFMDETKDIFFAYLYHATGARPVADGLMLEIYLRLLSRAMSLWWFGNLTFKLLIKTSHDVIEEAIASHSADVDTVYLPTLYWLSDEEKDAMLSLHDSLWTMSSDDQALLILLYLVGVSPDRVATLLGKSLAAVNAQKETATKILFAKWNPPESLKAQMQSLVYLPTLSLARESAMRFAIVEKYNALRMRRMHWVMMGALFAVCSNFLVAGILAFVVVIQPPTSLRNTKADLVAFNAIILQKEQRKYEVDQSLKDIYTSAQNLGAYDAVQALTSIGLTKAQPALQQRQKKIMEIQKLKDAVDKTIQVALHPTLPVRLAFDLVQAFLRMM